MLFSSFSKAEPNHSLKGNGWALDATGANTRQPLKVAKPVMACTTCSGKDEAQLVISLRCQACRSCQAAGTRFRPTYVTARLTNHRGPCLKTTSVPSSHTQGGRVSLYHSRGPNYESQDASLRALAWLRPQVFF